MDDRARNTHQIMENQSSFDLNRAIQRWRADLARSAAYRNENLNDLESHLRDSVDRLRTPQLSDEEAFLIATRRVGNAPRLEQEFGKVNGAAIWFDRFLWILVAVQLWSLISSMSSFLFSAALPLCISLNEILPGIGLPKIEDEGLLSAVLQIIMSPLPTFIVAALIWRFLVWPKRRGWGLIEKLSRRPAKLALTVFLLCLGMHLASAWALQAWYYPLAYPHVSIQGLQWRLYFWQLPVLAFWAGLTYFIARKRLRSSVA
jgi:hypothetical protein